MADMFGGRRTSNSGGGKWDKSDVVIEDADMLVECKTVTKPRNSFSIKQEWLDKNVQESLSKRKTNSMLAFSFSPDASPTYFVINEKLARFLVEKLKEDFQS